MHGLKNVGVSSFGKENSYKLVTPDYLLFVYLLLESFSTSRNLFITQSNYESEDISMQEKLLTLRLARYKLYGTTVLGCQVDRLTANCYTQISQKILIWFDSYCHPFRIY